ncbi:hypothetical protein [Nostoc sp.]|uniref:hypothetical protein n=1 Tax=Nostoc sp. TaxID=1180 RepID=UPI002FFA359B
MNLLANIFHIQRILCVRFTLLVILFVTTLLSQRSQSQFQQRQSQRFQRSSAISLNSRFNSRRTSDRTPSSTASYADSLWETLFVTIIILRSAIALLLYVKLTRLLHLVTTLTNQQE